MCVHPIEIKLTSGWAVAKGIEWVSVQRQSFDHLSTFIVLCCVQIVSGNLSELLNSFFISANKLNFHPIISAYEMQFMCNNLIGLPYCMHYACTHAYVIMAYFSIHFIESFQLNCFVLFYFMQHIHLSHCHPCTRGSGPERKIRKIKNCTKKFHEKCFLSHMFTHFMATLYETWLQLYLHFVICQSKFENPLLVFFIIILEQKNSIEIWLF